MEIAVLTVSDRSYRGEREDLSGPAASEAVQQHLGWHCTKTAIVPDDLNAIAAQLRTWADEERITLILTTGGTGFSPSDVTPEATREVIAREAPGLVEAVRATSLRITSHAMLSRAVSGIRGQSLIVNLPGSPQGVREAIEILAPALPHALEVLSEVPKADTRHRHDVGNQKQISSEVDGN